MAHESQSPSGRGTEDFCHIQGGAFYGLTASDPENEMTPQA